MKSRYDLFVVLLEEFGRICEVDTSKSRETALRRWKSEGDEFFTVHLANFGKDFDRCLALESIPPDLFKGWRRTRVDVVVDDGKAPVLKKTKGTPVFLREFLDQIFVTDLVVDTGHFPDGDFGPLFRRNGSDVARAANAVWALRQLTRLFSKEKKVCDENRIQLAFDQYLETDKSLSDPLVDERRVELFHGSLLDDVRRVIRLVFGDALSSTDRAIYEGALIPAHGPGKTADRLLGNQKWVFRSWHQRLERLFPFQEYAVASPRYIEEREGDVELIPPEKELPVKVTPVPKTQLTPRLIAQEPTVMQYIQQAIARHLTLAIEAEGMGRRFTSFTDQNTNRAMAHLGSEDGSLATLDLSEASDRIANWLVEDLFSDFPHFSEGIEACRSTRARLPDGQVVRLEKFASMGSALTFPVEAMIFTAAAIVGCLRARGLPLERSTIGRLIESVHVFGDDIIVPVDATNSVIRVLHSLGFVVNEDKSFWTGGFRESCGKEFWYGFDVSTVKVRTGFPNSPDCATEVISTVSLRNLFYAEGLIGTCDFLDSLLMEATRGYYPIVSSTSPILGRVDDFISYDVGRWNRRTHSFEVKGWAERSRSPKNGIDDSHALLKCYSHPGISELDPEHSRRSGRPRAASLKLVWGPPF